ncbi:MAG: hypothetical protein R2831_07620 [Chitinophagaceae bacterium]
MKNYFILIILFAYSCTMSPKNKFQNLASNEKLSYTNFLHPQLSNQFNIKVHVEKNQEHIQNMSLGIYDKKSNALLDSFIINTDNTYRNDLFYFQNTQSFCTNYNVNKENREYNTGDIIVADFNFDNKDDIAVRQFRSTDSNVNYHFYIQQNDHTFCYNSFLSESMSLFPSKIDKQTKTLTTEYKTNQKKTTQKNYRHSSANGWLLLQE